ncbi:MAG: methyltransferase [Candidatus Brennerbacteria bacterium]|nr:methyltransferase [Candidatus Brennerbacteria bacterium]
MANFKFLKATLKDFRVGALTVSSRYTIRRVLKEIKSHHKFIIEYGAGDGAATKEILRFLPRDGKLIVIELNDDFVRELQKIKDERLKIIRGDAVELSKNLKLLGLPRVDMVISSIPFTLLKPTSRAAIIKNTGATLAANGIFLIYQYSPLVMPILKKYFKNVRLDLELRNFPPYFFMIAKN